MHTHPISEKHMRNTKNLEKITLYFSIINLSTFSRHTKEIRGKNRLRGKMGSKVCINTSPYLCATSAC